MTVCGCVDRWFSLNILFLKSRKLSKFASDLLTHLATVGEESPIFIKRVFCTQVQLPFYPWCKVVRNEKMAFGDNTEGDRKVNFSVNITFNVGIKNLLFPFFILKHNLLCVYENGFEYSFTQNSPWHLDIWSKNLLPLYLSFFKYWGNCHSQLL